MASEVTSDLSSEISGLNNPCSSAFLAPKCSLEPFLRKGRKEGQNGLVDLRARSSPQIKIKSVCFYEDLFTVWWVVEGAIELLAVVNDGDSAAVGSAQWRCNQDLVAPDLDRLATNNLNKSIFVDCPLESVSRRPPPLPLSADHSFPSFFPLYSIRIGTIL